MTVAQTFHAVCVFFHLQRFLVLSESAIFAYKVDNVYAPDYDAGIYWNDPMLNIPWVINESEIRVSEKDSKLSSFSRFKSPFVI